MAKASELGVSGIGPLSTQAVLGSVATGLVAVGATAVTSLQLGAVNNFVTTSAAATGVMLPAGGAGDVIFIMNRAGQALIVYPPTGATVNNTTSFSQTSAKGAFYVYSSATAIEPCLSA
jgi:hypothetical protein